MATAKKIRDNDGYERFFAHVTEAGFAEDLKAICLRHHVTLKEIYLDTRGPTVYAARLEAWWWMTSAIHKSSSEIARIFDRDPSSILHALTRLKEAAQALGESLDGEGSHKVAKQMSRELAEARVSGGRKGGLKAAK